MSSIRQNTARILQSLSLILLIWVGYASYALASEARVSDVAIAKADREQSADSVGRRHLQYIRAQGDHVPVRRLMFTHLGTNDGLSQSNVTAILQDRQGFMWFATRDGLNRYDGNTFVVYKHNPNDPSSLSANYLQDLMEDTQGYLWIATLTGGADKFDPRTERFTRYRHDPGNSNSIGGDSVYSIARDSRGHLWFGTGDSGVDKFDPATGNFTHYLNDSDGLFVGKITHVIADGQGEIWFVGARGLFHLNPATGQITRAGATLKGLSADYVDEDSVGNLWMLAYSPIVGLVKYDRRTERFTKYSLGAGAVGVANSKLLEDRQNGLWVPSNQGLQYFDRRTKRFTRRFQHDESDPDSLSDNTVVSIYQDRGGLLWVGTENGGLNLLNFRQEQFGSYRHRPSDSNSLSPGKVTAIYAEPTDVLWIGFFPRGLDRLDRKTGLVTHYHPGRENARALGKGSDLNSIYKDARGYVWLGGWNSSLDRFEERTGLFKHYLHDPSNPESLMSNNVLSIHGDRNGQIWVGQEGGVGRFDPVTDGFANYRPVPENPSSLENNIGVIFQDRSAVLWLGSWGGALSRFDETTKRFVNYTPDPRDARRLNGGGINSILEDRTGTLWLGAWDGLYRQNRKDATFTRYTESQGLPSSAIQAVLEDKLGRLWLSTKNGISRFDPVTERFRNYDVSDGLQGDEFSQGACAQGPDGEMFFGGSNGFNAFLPETIRDNPYVPPVVITSFRIFNKPVPIGVKSVLAKAISYADGLTLSYHDTIFSFEFAALSYANSPKNQYRYRLEGLEHGWNEVGSKHRLATYTNLDPGKYVFRVQGSNSDGVWNEQGVSLSIQITPPWWRTNWFRAFWAAAFMALLWVAYQYRVRRLHHEFEMTLDTRVSERTRIARDLHDTLLQSFHGLLLRFQTVALLLPERPIEAKEKLDSAIEQAAGAITEGRDAVQGLRASTVERNDLAVAIRALGEELANASRNHRPATFRVAVEGQARDLHPILRDEIYKIAAEALRNAFHHAQAKQVEVEVRYDHDEFRLRVRDDGKGIDAYVLSSRGVQGHYGLHGMRERAALIRGKLVVWSEVDAGTEVELRVPASAAYMRDRKPSWWLRRFAPKA
jgi:signal transduction histidine kinase/ligand-binding sensor domain-containing protein